MTDGDRDEVQQADADADVPPDGFERDEVLDLLEDGIREAHRKVTTGRVRDPENETVRIKWIRVLAYASGQYRQLKNDEELDEMAERIEALEAGADQSVDQFRVK